MRQAPTEAEQTIKLRSGSGGIHAIAPGRCAVERTAKLLRFAVRDLVCTLLIPFGATRAFRKVQHDRRRSAAHLVSKVRVVFLHDLDE